MWGSTVLGDGVGAAGALSQPCIHALAELGGQLDRDEALDGAAEPAAVNTHCAASVQDVLCQAQGEHGVLLAHVNAGEGDVLQVHGRACARLARVGEEGIDVPVLQGCPAFVNEVVLVPVVNGAQHGAIPELLAERRHGGIEIGGVGLAQARMAELRGDRLHLSGGGGVLMGEVGVVRADFHQNEGVAVVLEGEGEFFGGGSGVLEVHE